MMKLNGVTNHAKQRALEIYGDWLDTAEVVRRISAGEFTRQLHSSSPSGRKYVFDLDFEGTAVRVVAMRNCAGQWELISCLPPEFPGKTRQDNAAQRRQEYFRHARHSDEDDDLQTA